MSLRPGIDVIARVEAPAPQGRSAWVIVVSASVACIGIALASGTHLGLVLIALPVFIAIVWQSPKTMVGILPVWMVLLGMLRRLTPGGSNITFSGDPVLIIGPIVILLLFFVAASRGAFEHRSRFATAVGALSVIALFEAFNPKQGNLLAGLGGLLFILVPMLAFWIGRTLLDEVLALQIVRTIAVLGLGSAIYGLIQEFRGLPSWDQQWITSNGYQALTIGSGVIRAFGTFSSAEEYAAFLSISLVAWLALARTETRLFPPAHLAGTVTVAVALWFESERTAIFLVVLAIGVMAASRLRMRPIGVLAGGIGAVALLIVLGGHFGGSGGGTSAASQLSTHASIGIESPFGSGSSLPGHIRQTEKGMLQAFKSPLGHGTGSVTLAASRYAHSKTGGTEFDPGNMGIAFGVFGLIAFVVVLWQAIKTAYLGAVIRRDVISLFALGMLMATLFSWTNGDLYSVCWLIWLFLGYLDMSLVRARAEIAARPPPPPAFEWRRPGELR
ncbi:MAG TPA: hypothetical protein VMQ40_07325 [Acidimicrobiales bacterium]|nr:hypothetical protein [Acidimicrobiales bacterium]